MKKRKIPMRKDLLSNQMMPKKELVRITIEPTFYDDLFAYVDHQKARQELFGK